MTEQAKDLQREDSVLDTRGLLCPMPVIRASNAIKALAAGQVLKVLATDPGSKADFPAWAEAAEHRLLKQETKDGVFIYWIQKG